MSIREIFSRHERCFIPFITAGHPDLESSEQIILELSRAGAQIIEIGIPFSDPIADGPVIQQSSFDALQHGYRMEDYLQLVRAVRKKTEAGLLFMTYLNPVLSYGFERLHVEGKNAGLDGVLISDLTPEEHRRMKSSETSLETVFLVAPTSTDERIRRVCQEATGFVYLIARTGVTGEKSEVGTVLETQVERIRRYTSLPVAVGFGIRTSADVARIWEIAEGAIVGSAIVQFIEQNKNAPDLAKRVGSFVKEKFLSFGRVV